MEDRPTVPCTYVDSYVRKVMQRANSSVEIHLYHTPNSQQAIRITDQLSCF